MREEPNEPELPNVELPEINREPADTSMAGYLAGTPGLAEPDRSEGRGPQPGRASPKPETPGAGESPIARPAGAESSSAESAGGKAPGAKPAGAGPPTAKPGRAGAPGGHRPADPVPRGAARPSPRGAPGGERRSRVGPITVAGVAAVVVGGGCWAYFSGLLG